MRIPILSALLVLSLPACSTPATPGPITPGPATPAESGAVKGTVLDAQGQPIAGAIVWVHPSVTTGLVEVKTDANGQYRVTALPNVPFAATAWTKIKYRGETYCLRVPAENESQYAVFGGREGAVRNFRLQLSGRVPDSDNDTTFFGGEVRIMTSSWQGADESVPLPTSKVEVTLVPNGALIDGSAGQTIVRTTKPGENMLYDIPIGVYSVTAVEVRPDGSRSPVQISHDYYVERGLETTLAFKPNSSLCGGGPGTTSFVGRAVLYVARPNR